MVFNPVWRAGEGGVSADFSAPSRHSGPSGEKKECQGTLYGNKEMKCQVESIREWKEAAGEANAKTILDEIKRAESQRKTGKKVFACGKKKEKDKITQFGRT